MGWLSSSKKPAKVKVAKCPHPGCRKSVLACPGHREGGEKEKERVRVEGKDGRTRTVTRNTGRVVRDGITWCSCGCRVLNGRCTNATCSTNRSDS